MRSPARCERRTRPLLIHITHALLLVQWAGEGWGQLISLQINSSRQIAGGVFALLFTCLSGSFPTLPQSGVFTALSSISFVRWGMQALFSIEYAPWYYGDPGHQGYCCDDLQTWKNGNCDLTSAPRAYVTSKCDVASLLQNYGYTRFGNLDISKDIGHDWFQCDAKGVQPDVARGGGLEPAESSFAFSMLLTIGIATRFLTYLSLLFMDRARRR